MLGMLISLGFNHEFHHPEGDANYIDRHNYVDTNYVSSGGRERMK
jgi:hypothetical protein